jgi:predicted lipid-binding transport protein (Tim44 family)
MLDILFFLGLAVYFFIRYRGVLGAPPEDTPTQKPFSFAQESSVITLNPDEITSSDPSSPSGGSSLDHILKAMAKIDPTFSEKSFLGGAKEAFKIIVTAFAAGDKETLAPLLSPDVFKTFCKTIDPRKKNKETGHFTLHRIRDAIVNQAMLQGSQATIDVIFDSDQAEFVKEAEGNVIEGDADHIIEVRDIWSFARDLKAPNPNWSLVAVRAGSA